MGLAVGVGVSARLCEGVPWTRDTERDTRESACVSAGVLGSGPAY